MPTTKRKTQADKDRIQLAAYVDEAFATRVAQVAAAQDRTISSLIRAALRRELAHNERAAA